MASQLKFETFTNKKKKKKKTETKKETPTGELSHCLGCGRTDLPLRALDGPYCGCCRDDDDSSAAVSLSTVVSNLSPEGLYRPRSVLLALADRIHEMVDDEDEEKLVEFFSLRVERID